MLLHVGQHRTLPEASGHRCQAYTGARRSERSHQAVRDHVICLGHPDGSLSFAAQTSDVAPIYRFIKRLHGDSAIQLNKLDSTPGRQVWYQYFDRFPRDERDFWAYFNYIHVNPIKHGYVQVSDDVLIVEGKQVQVAAGRALDVHLCLAQYPHSSYHYYVREYSAEFLTDVWKRYPIPDYLAHDGS